MKVNIQKLNENAVILVCATKLVQVVEVING